MRLFIAKTHGSEIMSVILAKTPELAKAFWHGAEVFPHSVSEVSLEERQHPLGVTEIVGTEEVEVKGFHGLSDTRRAVKK